MMTDKKEDDPAIVVTDISEDAKKDTPKIDNKKTQPQKEVK